MSQTKVLETGTDVTKVGNNITIRSFYSPTDTLPNILNVFIATEDAELDGIAYRQGDLVVRFKNPSDISVSLNSNGEFIIIADDANQYSINSDGELEYNTL